MSIPVKGGVTYLSFSPNNRTAACGSVSERGVAPVSVSVKWAWPLSIPELYFWYSVLFRVHIPDYFNYLFILKSTYLHIFTI